MTFRTLGLAVLMSAFATPLWAMGLMVHDVRVQLSPIEGRPAAAYLTLMNHGDEADILTHVDVKGAERAELHESRMEGGAMVMRKLDRVTIGVDETQVFAPGGQHIMIFGLKGVKLGEAVTLTLHFEKQGDLVIDALATGPKASNTGGNDHKPHH